MMIECILCSVLYSRILGSLALVSLSTFLFSVHQLNQTPQDSALSIAGHYHLHHLLPKQNAQLQKKGQYDPSMPPVHVVLAGQFSSDSSGALMSSIRKHATGPIRVYCAGSEQNSLDLKDSEETEVTYLNITAGDATRDEFWIDLSSELFPGRNIHKALIIDVDTSVNCDVYSLVRDAFTGEKYQERAIASVPSFGGEKTKNKDRGKHVIPGLSNKAVSALGVQDTEMTMLGGLWIVNFDQWTQQQFPEKIRNISEWNQNEQLYNSSTATGLEIVARDHFQPLPLSWNVPTEKLDGVKMTKDVQQNICMLHYSNPKDKLLYGQRKIVNESEKKSDLADAVKADKKRSMSDPRASNLLICRYFAPLCDGTPNKLKDAKSAGIEMHSRVWGIGGFWTSMIGFLCFGIGLFISKLIDGSESYPGHDDFDDSKKDERCKYEEYLPLTESRGDTKSSRQICSGISRRVVSYWTDSRLEPFTEPLLSFKCFLAFLLFLELNYVVAPQQTVLGAAEIVELKQAYPKRKAYIYPWAELFMPGLQKNNAIDWVTRLELVRTILIISWFVFLLLPKKKAYVGGIFYSVGAVAYVYLGVIMLMYTPAHCTQAAMLFILSAIPAVPVMETNKRANHWLRKFLYIGILNPVYLFAGICKIRYKGIVSNVTGRWMRKIIDHQDVKRVVLKRIFKAIRAHSHPFGALMSWGNIVTELVLPTWMIIRTDSWQLQLVFHVAQIVFHTSILLLIGPNFMRICLLHVFASNPLGYVRRWQKERGALGHSVRKKKEFIYRDQGQDRYGSSKRWGDCIRISWALFMLMGWWYVQFRSDYLHLIGSARSRMRTDPYFPWPELSMFVYGGNESANFVAGLMMTIATALVQIFAMIR